jgi:phage-related protein
MEVMFGTDAIRAANIMFGEGSAGIDKMTTEMLKFTAADVAKEKMNNLKGQIEEMKGSLETAGIQLGTIFIPLLRDLVTNYIQPAIDKFAGLSTEMQKKIVIVAGVVAAIGPLMWILGQTITTVTTVISLVKNLGVVFTLLTGPIGIVVVAIAALVAAVIYMWNTNETFRTNVIACWEMIKEAAIGIFNGIKIFWDEWGSTIIEFFKIWGSGVLGFITYLMNTMMNSIRTVLELIGGIIKFFTAVFQGDWQGAWEAMQEIGTTILNFIKRQIEIVIEAIVGVFARLGIDLPAMWSSMWYSVWSTVDSIVSRIIGIIDAVIGKVLSVIDAIRNFNAMEVATKVFRTVHETVNTVIQAASNIIPHAAGGIFTKPTLLGNHLFGEAGDEALIPINKLDNMISGGSGDRPIIVYLEGKKIYEGLDSYLGNRLVGLGAV